jgi:hypothetical protein
MTSKKSKNNIITTKSLLDKKSKNGGGNDDSVDFCNPLYKYYNYKKCHSSVSNVRKL